MPVEITSTISANLGYILTGLGGIGLLLVAKQPRKAVGAALVLVGTLATKIGIAMGASDPAGGAK